MNNLISNFDFIRNDEKKYKSWKISILLHSTYKYMIDMDYGIQFDDDETGVKWEIDNDVLELIEQLYEKFKNLDFSNISYYKIIQFNDDDFYGIVLYNDKMEILKKYFWNFDLYLFDDITGYDFIDDYFDLSSWE